MEKTREFIQNYLQPIIDLENEGTETSIIFKEDMIPYLEVIMREKECELSINVLEIGFGGGFAAVFLLFSNPNVRITCIDEGYHRYSYACFEKIREHFGNDRIRFYLGNSNTILPILHLFPFKTPTEWAELSEKRCTGFASSMQNGVKEKYDIIHYDGSGTTEVVEKDFILSYPLLNENTIAIFSNKDLRELWEKYSKRYHLENIPEIDSIYFRKRSIQIPRKIHRIWQTDICANMQEYSNRLKNENSDFEYFIYNADSAREFIKEHFDTVVLHAFDSIVPFSFKADLFRYCVMYIHGGIYLDMKFESVNGFRFAELIEKEQYVLDVDGFSVYNALLICKPRSKVMFKCIFQIVKHVKDKDYTDCDLSITGPGMIKHMVTKEMKAESRLKHECINYNKYILRDGIPILKNYHRYYEDTPKCGQKNYLEYWRNREIYLDIDLSSYNT